MTLGDAQRRCIAAAVCTHPSLVDDYAAAHLNDSDRVPITVRVNTNNKVQLIWKHPATSNQAWGTSPVPVWGQKPLGGNTVMGHAQRRTGF
jgi:hypothetical protein